MNIQCEFCPRSFSARTFKKHLNIFHEDCFNNDNELTIYALKIRHNINDNYIAKVIDEHKASSIYSIFKKYKLPYNAIKQILEIYGEKPRSIQEAMSLESVKAKRINTCKEVFGVNNPSKAESVKEKKKQTFMRHYGVDNIFKTEDFKSKIDEILLNKYGKRRLTNVEKRIKTNIDRYGVAHPAQIPGANELKESNSLKKYRVRWPIQHPEVIAKQLETKNNWTDERRALFHDRASKAHKARFAALSDEEKNSILHRLHKNGFSSSLEIRIQNILNSWHISYTHPFIFSFRSYDFLIKDFRVLIEVQGDYWHANPRIYKANDLLHYPYRVIKSAAEVWEKDEYKKQLAIKNNYTYVDVWEKDIRSFKDEKGLEKFLISRIVEEFNANSKDKINQKDSIRIKKIRHTNKEK